MEIPKEEILEFVTWCGLASFELRVFTSILSSILWDGKGGTRLERSDVEIDTDGNQRQW